MNIYIILAAVAVIVVYRRPLWKDIQFLRREPRKWLQDKWKEWGEPFAVAIILAVIIRTFLVGPYKIPTGSMEPTLMIGDRIFVDKLSYRFREPKRGEVIVFKYPLDLKKDFVKRLIGMGDEVIEIKDGSVLINGKKIEGADLTAGRYYYNRNDWDYGKESVPITVPKDAYFVLGDNSGHSSDSRNWGFVPKKDLVGRAIVIWWPLKRIGYVK